ncbi:MAG: GHKL domain-containing protein [Lachnospiraceae bacterium]|nr:GHKL domain-containing protein [Lachnospiraceae bacterium]
MNYLFYVAQFLICVMEICLFYIWGRTFIGVKERSKLISGICIAVASGIMFLFEIIPVALLYRSFLCLIPFIGVGVALLQRKGKILLFYTFVYCTLGLSIAFIFNRELHLPITVLVQGIICFLLMKKLKPERSAYCVEKHFLFDVLAGCVFIFTACAYSLADITDGFNVENGLVVGGSFVVILTEAILLYLVKEFSKSIWASEEARLCIERDEMAKKHYQNMEEQHEQYDVVIHDMKHVIGAMAALSQLKGENSEDIIRLMKRINLSIGKVSDKEYCRNKVLNALLIEKSNFAEEMGVELDLEVIEPLQLSKIDELDLITLMGNLLDNAIIAESKVNNPEGVFCRIALSMNFEHITIQVENSYEGKPFKVKMKPEGEIGNKHGIGLDSIEEIVRKYGGVMNTFKEEGRYFTGIVIPI